MREKKNMMFVIDKHYVSDIYILFTVHTLSLVFMFFQKSLTLLLLVCYDLKTSTYVDKIPRKNGHAYIVLSTN
jgi:hypothetical protein